MNYPSTYLLMKDTCCHCMVCKHDAECEKCEFGEIRKQAARDERLTMREALRSIMDVNWTKLACEHGTELGEDQQFDALVTAIDKAQTVMKRAVEKEYQDAGVR